MKDFHELKVWQQTHQLTLAVYQVTTGFPPEERFGLTSQLRRCSASIPANLAEGCGRSGGAEFAPFCSIAMGSASELEYHLLLAKDLNLIKPKGSRGTITTGDGTETHANRAPPKADR